MREQKNVVETVKKELGNGEEIRGGEREETKEERKRGNAEIEESDVREQS